MAEFEEELIDAEEIFDKIKGRIYNLDEIIVNIESLFLSLLLSCLYLSR